MQVGAVFVLAPIELRQHLGFQFARIGRKADDINGVAWILRADQMVERQRHFLAAR